jgi:hypothetical protein
MAKWGWDNTVGMENITSDESILIFPNPASETFRIKFPDKAIRKLHLYNINGRLISENQISEMDYIFNSPEMIPGTYILQIMQEGNIKTLKIIIP